MSGLGLSEIGDLSSLLTGDNNRGWKEISIDLIREDPHQPRQADNPGFSLGSLRELAATIELRGVKSPISVREDQDQPGHFIINHGARRFRASIIAKKKSIPAFVDNDYNEADQIVENLQRDELTAREIADFIGREIARGRQKKDIAASIGKSSSFVSQHVALLSLPDPINYAFVDGRSKDVTVINELVVLFKKHEEAVVRWLADPQQEITRKTVKLLREFIENKIAEKDSEIINEEPEDTTETADIPVPNGTEEISISPEQETDHVDVQPEQTKKSDKADTVQTEKPAAVNAKDQEKDDVTDKGKEKEPAKLGGKFLNLWVEYADGQALLLLDKVPTETGYAWIKPMAGQSTSSRPFQVKISEIKLLAIEHE